MKDYDAEPPRAEFDHLATKRPRTVTAGVIIIAVQALFSVLLALYLFGKIGGAPANAAGLGTAQLLTGVILASGVINGIALVFVVRGYGIARIAIVVVGGVVVVLDLVTLQPTVGDFLWILAVVLLFLPASNLFFSARATVRAASKKGA